MIKKATKKQVNYLNYILDYENLKLNDFTKKQSNELTHFDIKNILEKLNIKNKFTPDFKNKKYIIEKETDNYILGKQIIHRQNSTIIYHLICFKDLLILDWDTTDSKKSLLHNIKSILSNVPYTFLLYETFNGYHAYCVSHNFDYNDYNTHKLMKTLKCDDFYIEYIKKTGFVVRLNKKENRNEEYIEKFICQINDFKIDECLKFLVELKDSLLQQ